MLEQIRILLDAARYRLSECYRYGEGYAKHKEAEDLVKALSQAETAAENYAALQDSCQG